MPSLALYVFGVPRVERDGIPVRVQRRKVMALLIYLAVTGETHSRDTLAALFWPDEDPGSAHAALRRTLSELRAITGDKPINSNPDTIAWLGSPGFWLDADEFRRRMQAVRIHQHPLNQPCSECMTSLAEAVLLYQADFMAGFSLKKVSPGFDEWMCLETESLRRELIEVLKQLALFHQAYGEATPAILFARRWLTLDPTDEVAHQLLMRLYAASGQRSAALRQYQECAHILGFEFGINPQEETTQLYEHIRSNEAWSEVPSSVESAQRHLSSLHRSGNLPAQVNTFIGRQLEIETALEKLAQPEVRLLTLTGTGGVGKTRLGLQIAHQLQDVFEHGIFFVPFASLKDAKLTASAVAHCLGIRETCNRTIQEALLEALYDRHMLLILDNFEHVLPSAPLVSELLVWAPKLKILATSRVPLHVYGEHLIPVPPLSLPDPRHLPSPENALEFEGVQLFVERAQAAHPGFTLNAHNALDVTRICLGLDGLPLAIELAASHIRSLPPSAMLAQFDGQGSQFPFTLLSNGPRDAPARHQTLHNAIAWSYDLLDGDEQTLFRRLSVFNGGCSLDAVQAVCLGESPSPAALLEASSRAPAAMEVVTALETLLDKSLLIQSVVGEESRFHMLEMIRIFALEQLSLSGEEQVIRHRHAEFYLALAEAASSKINSLSGQPWQMRLERERDNFRSVLAWGLLANEESPLEWRLKAVLPCLETLPISFSERRLWMEQALSRLHSIPGVAQEKGLSLLEADLWGAAGSSAYFQGDYPAARTFLERGLSLLRELDDRPRLAGTLIAYCWTILAQEDRTHTKALAEEAWSLGKDINAPGIMAHALNHLACLAWLQRDYELSARMYTESLNFFIEGQDRFWEAMLYLNMGQLAQDQDDQAQARELYRKGLRLCWKLTHRWGIGLCLEKVARTAAAYGQLTQAARLFAAAETLLESTGFAIEPVERPGHEAYFTRVRTGLDSSAFDTAWAAGQAMPLERAVIEGLGEAVGAS